MQGMKGVADRRPKQQAQTIVQDFTAVCGTGPRKVPSDALLRGGVGKPGTAELAGAAMAGAAGQDVRRNSGSSAAERKVFLPFDAAPPVHIPLEAPPHTEGPSMLTTQDGHSFTDFAESDHLIIAFADRETEEDDDEIFGSVLGGVVGPRPVAHRLMSLASSV